MSASSRFEPKEGDELGRKKIKISRITSHKSRQVTFNKRKVGLMKKAMELSILCDCDIAVIVFDHQKQLYQYCSKPGSNSMEQLLQRWQKYDGQYEALTNGDLQTLKPGRAASFRVGKKRKNANGTSSSGGKSGSNKKRKEEEEEEEEEDDEEEEEEEEEEDVTASPSKSGVDRRSARTLKHTNTHPLHSPATALLPGQSAAALSATPVQAHPLVLSTSTGFTPMISPSASMSQASGMGGAYAGNYTFVPPTQSNALQQVMHSQTSLLSPHGGTPPLSSPFAPQQSPPSSHSGPYSPDSMRLMNMLGQKAHSMPPNYSNPRLAGSLAATATGTASSLTAQPLSSSSLLSPAGLPPSPHTLFTPSLPSSASYLSGFSGYHMPGVGVGSPAAPPPMHPSTALPLHLQRQQQQTHQFQQKQKQMQEAINKAKMLEAGGTASSMAQLASSAALSSSAVTSAVRAATLAETDMTITDSSKEAKAEANNAAGTDSATAAAAAVAALAAASAPSPSSAASAASSASSSSSSSSSSSLPLLPSPTSSALLSKRAFFKLPLSLQIPNKAALELPGAQPILPLASQKLSGAEPAQVQEQAQTAGAAAASLDQSIKNEGGGEEGSDTQMEQKEASSSKNSQLAPPAASVPPASAPSTTTSPPEGTNSQLSMAPAAVRPLSSSFAPLSTLAPSSAFGPVHSYSPLTSPSAYLSSDPHSHPHGALLFSAHPQHPNLSGMHLNSGGVASHPHAHPHHPQQLSAHPHHPHLQTMAGQQNIHTQAQTQLYQMPLSPYGQWANAFGAQTDANGNKLISPTALRSPAAAQTLFSRVFNS